MIQQRRFAAAVRAHSSTCSMRSVVMFMAGMIVMNRTGSRHDYFYMTVEPESKFGIKTRAGLGLTTLAQGYSLIAGVAYLALGVIGFFRTGFSGGTGMMNDMLFGIFMVNPFHNVVHLTVGVLWLLAAFVLSPAGAEGLNLAMGAFWALATVLGFLGYLSALAVMSGTTPDTFLHLGTAVVTLLFGTGLLRAFISGDRPAAA